MIFNEEHVELMDDFEDLLPPFLLQRTEDISDSPSTAFANEECNFPDETLNISDSSDVVIVEANDQPLEQPESSRVLRPRAIIDAVHLKRPSPRKPILKNVTRSKKSNGRRNKVKKSIHHPPAESNCPTPMPFQHQVMLGLPSVHDLIDLAASIGAALSASNKAVPPPQLGLHKQSQPVTLLRSHKRKQTACNTITNAAEMESAAILHRSRAVFSRLQSKACRVAASRSSEFLLKHPFLYPWERDEDRMAGGQWRARRECYKALLRSLEERVQYVDTDSDAENSPPLPRSGEPRASGKRQPKVPQRAVSPDATDSSGRCISALEPCLLGYRWSPGHPPAASPEKMLFWR